MSDRINQKDQTSLALTADFDYSQVVELLGKSKGMMRPDVQASVYGGGPILPQVDFFDSARAVKPGAPEVHQKGNVQEAPKLHNGSVPAIEARAQGVPTETGSGVFVHNSEARPGVCTVATADHVITAEDRNRHPEDPATHTRITVDGRPASLVSRDHNNDLAILQLNVPPAEQARLCPEIPIAPTGRPHAGESAVAEGYPQNQPAKFDGQVLTTAARMGFELPQGQLPWIESTLNTKIDVPHGLSGGALTNGRGELTGIASRFDPDTNTILSRPAYLLNHMMKRESW